MSIGKRILVGYVGSFVGLLILGGMRIDDPAIWQEYVTSTGVVYFWLAVLVGVGYLFFRRAR